MTKDEHLIIVDKVANELKEFQENHKNASEITTLSEMEFLRESIFAGLGQ